MSRLNARNTSCHGFQAAFTTCGEEMEGVVIDHIDFPVSDYARSKAFYEQALAAVRWSAKCSRI